MANYVTEIGEISKVKLHGHIDASIAPALMEELKPLIVPESAQSSSRNKNSVQMFKFI